MAPSSLAGLRRKRRDDTKAYQAKLKRVEMRYELFMYKFRDLVESYQYNAAKLNVLIAAAEEADAKERQAKYEQYVKDMDKKVAAWKAEDIKSAGQ